MGRMVDKDMILTGPEIAREVDNGRIKIAPFTPAHITPTSYDLTLGDTLLLYQGGVIDTAKPPPTCVVEIPEDGYKLEVGQFVLGHSVEEIGSDHYAALIHARSGIARLGLFVHVTSDLIQTGSFGQINFQFYATMPMILKRGMRIGQITFWQPKGDIQLYRGKYQGQRGVRGSDLYQEFEQK